MLHTEILANGCAALLPSSPSLSSFVIPDTPDAASNLALARYLGGGKESRLQNEPHMNDMQRNLMEVMEGANYRFMQSGQDAYTVYLDLKQEMANSASEQASTLRKVLTSALEQAKEWDLTIALMPETSTSFFSKRSAQSNWFADLPSSGRPDLVPVANHDTNVANPPHSPSFPEDIYVSHDSQSASADSSTHKSSWLDTLYPFNSDDDTSSDSTPAWKSPVSAILASGNNTNTTAPKGILPQCFSSQSACESTTHSCSGHGSCSLKYKDSTGSGKGSCWSCSCSVSRHTNKDGTVKTTRWTGPACQKKDVSFEFWLLASVTVGLLSGIVFGVGMLMEMGSAELPSVIGSGVAGVRSKN